MAVGAPTAISVSAAQAAGPFTVLHYFHGIADGGTGNGLVFDSAGNLYGTTQQGGKAQLGTVFKLSPPASGAKEWTLTTLYEFTGYPDGAVPFEAVAIDQAGNIYGTTTAGGSSQAGTVFEVSPPATAGKPWTETILYAFTGGNDGLAPYSNIVRDAAGNLFGTTFVGGTNNWGVVFELAPPAEAGGAWIETVPYNFTGGADGGEPIGNLAIDSQGIIYGTAASQGSPVQGTVFRLAPPAQAGGDWAETTLYTFTGSGKDGATPPGGVVRDAHGNLFGETLYGSPSHVGAVFELSPPGPGGTAWTETTLHTFHNSPDGATPYGTPVVDSRGRVYVTTEAGGSTGAGTAVSLSPRPTAGKPWRETNLLSFNNYADGIAPNGALAIDAGGNVYGTTLYGGKFGYGLIFRLSPP